jgi:surface protein
MTTTDTCSRLLRNDRLKRFPALFALDSVLLHNDIPVELRAIAKSYLSESITDDNIADAVNQWMNEREVALVRYGHISHWDTGKVTNMSFLFGYRNQGLHHAVNFNDNLEDWDVSQVVTMQSLFYGCKNFNQPLNKWQTTSVKLMNSMFFDCHEFNQPLHGWDTSQVKDMSAMFKQAYEFNQPLHNWKVQKVEFMDNMFSHAFAFNQPIDTWDIHHVKSMKNMFSCAFAFNQPLINWRVNSDQVELHRMFYRATAFNPNKIATWKIKENTDIFAPRLSSMSTTKWLASQNEYFTALKEQRRRQKSWIMTRPAMIFLPNYLFLFAAFLAMLEFGRLVMDQMTNEESFSFLSFMKVIGALMKAIWLFSCYLKTDYLLHI